MTSDSMAEASIGGEQWERELREALSEGCDFGILRNICKGRTVSSDLRSQVWQIALNVIGKGDALSTWDEIYDMPEQALLREDCQAFVEKLGNDEDEKIALVSDLESVLTLFCKSRNVTYESDNGWLEILQPFIALKMPKSDLYNCFCAMMNRYIASDCVKDGKPFHLFRLLLLYHDPELCNFLDTKKVTPDMYAQSWVRSLFSAHCVLEVTQAMWDVYLQAADPFLIFFLSLVILINAKDQIIIMVDDSKQTIAETLVEFPCALEAEDIEDFCSLAQYYASRTPQSFRRDYQFLYGSPQESHEESLTMVKQALCLPVSVHELLQSVAQADDGVRYFIVDCRPAEQYNSGHLPTAFHLDANLMLQEPGEFAVAVNALFSAQKQAIAASSVAGGEHLCFMGSGREEEDQYVHMVVANFLQRKTGFVSLARGGYAVLHAVLGDRVNQALADHSFKRCIVCNPEAEFNGKETTDFVSEELQHLYREGGTLLGKLSVAMKSKSVEVKEKLANYIVNPQATTTKSQHVSNKDRLGKRYRNVDPVFTIDDDDDLDYPGRGDSSDEESKECVSIETWSNKPEVVGTFQCHEVLKDHKYMYPCHLIITKTHFYVLREAADKKGMAYIVARRSHASIVKITSKKRHPELISFRYGTSDENGLQIEAMDRFVIPNAGDCTKLIKQQIFQNAETAETEAK